MHHPKNPLLVEMKPNSPPQQPICGKRGWWRVYLFIYFFFHAYSWCLWFLYCHHWELQVPNFFLLINLFLGSYIYVYIYIFVFLVFILFSFLFIWWNVFVWLSFFRLIVLVGFMFYVLASKKNCKSVFFFKFKILDM